eukprot:symbB.v1.2.034333.t1/scaffold4414.1/size41512/1
MEHVAGLKANFVANGGNEKAFEELGRGSLGLADSQAQDGCHRPREARDTASRCFKPDALIEIQCYNSRGRSQGEEVLVFEKWISRTDLTFRASHLVASNEYYEWWATHEANYGRTVEDGFSPPEGRPAESVFPPRAAAPVTTSGLDGAPLEPGEGEKDEAAVDQLLSLAAAAKKGKVDLMALSQRDPGCLLRSALREMKKYLAARGEANKEDLTAGRVVSYLRQILLPQYPKAGLRSQRELVTLATGLDMLLEGDLGRLGDLLVQRFKAIEASLSADGNWSVARHQELIPTHASLSTRAEMTEAAKAELRASKLLIKQKKAWLKKRADSPQSEFREVSRKVSLRGGSASYDQGSSPQRSSRSKGGKKGGSEEREALGVESPVSGSWDTESQRGSDVTVEESELEREVEGEREKFLTKFSEFCAGLDLQGRSMSQMSVLLVQVLHRYPGVVGFYAEKAARQEIWTHWCHCPAPVPGSWDKLSSVLHDSMWSGLRSGARIHGGPIRKSQEDALSHLRRAAEYVIDGKEAPPLKGVPRTPKESWEKLVDEARISYHGEVIQKAEALEFDRVLPSLPPEGFGGIPDLASLCEGRVKEMVLDPKLCQLEEKDLPDVIPAPKVRVKDGDWEPLARALFERGILSPVDQVIGLRGKSVLNGLFGVQKAGRDLPDGRPAQRLIMDLRATTL